MHEVYARKAELIRRRFDLLEDDSPAAARERAAIRAESDDLDVERVWSVRRNLGRPDLYPGVPPEPGT